MIYRGTAWLDRWESYVWQPVNQRWAPLEERDEVAVLQHMIENTFGREAELRDREEASELLERADRDHAIRNDPRERATWIKSAILTANRTRIQREGARYRLDLLTR